MNIAENNVTTSNDTTVVYQNNVSVTTNCCRTDESVSIASHCKESSDISCARNSNISEEETTNRNMYEINFDNNNLHQIEPEKDMLNGSSNVISSYIDKESDNESVTCDTIINTRVKNILDSDEESNDGLSNKSIDKKAATYHRKKLNIIDSDSEEEKEVLPDKEAPVYCMDTKGNPILEKNNQSRLLAICDPDSEEDEPTYSDTEGYSENTISETSKNSRSKIKSRLDNDTRTKKLTGRDAQKLKKEIQSESQRMTRESAIHLPYHKPKSRTLKEFLQNRSCFSAALPISTSRRPPSLAIKMSTDQLKAISEKIAEREKEVKQFFKSESESEEEDNSERTNIDVQRNDSVKEHSENCHEITKPSPVNILQNIVLNPCKDVDVVEENSILSDQTLPQFNNIELDDKLKVKDSHLNKCNVEESQGTSDHNKDIKEDNTTDDRENEGHFIEKSETVESPSDNVNVDGVPKKDEIDAIVQIENKDTVNTNEQSEGDKICETKLNQNVGLPGEETQNLENNLSRLIEKYTSSEFISETLDEVTKNKYMPEEKSPKSILDLVKDKFGNFKPQLQGSSDEIINLEDGTTKVNEINQLINRFVKHTKKLNTIKHKVKLDIVSLSDGEIRKETVEMSINGEESIPVNEKPGERIKKLREELKMQMAQKRSEVWQQRSDTNIKDKTTVIEDEEESHEEKESNILDDDNEEEFTNTEDEEDEDIDEGTDEDMDENIETKPKNIFVDEEAEESDIDDDTEFENNGNDLEEGYFVDNESDIEDRQQSESNFEKHKKKKQLKRIIQPFSNESDDDESNLNINEDFKSKQEHLSLNNADDLKEAQLDSTDTWDECCEVTPHQARKSHTPIRKQTQSKSELGFLTPIVQLTGLQSLNSGSKFLHESPISPFVIPPDTSPIKLSSQNGPQKKLFADTDLTTTQELKEVAELCSGVFPSQSQELNGIGNIDDTTKDPNSVSIEPSVVSSLEPPSTQDLLEVCSGKFTGITQIEVSKQDKQDIHIPMTNELTSNKLSQNLTEVLIQNNEIKNLDDEDKLISEILNEEEMENFKRKFDSPSPSSVPFTRIIYDSSDEESNLPIKMKNRRRKLVFSDDEDSDEDEPAEDNNENIRLHDGFNEDDESNVDEVKNVEYDSEENEVEWDEEDKPKKIKIADFVENEAELSESEWGSADEDERDLDEFELEEGDSEKLDEQQVKRDLERIHIRRVLDDDNHEIKILQELLLDDGEMHGNGRERQFRWKNIDSIDNITEMRQDNGEIYLDEDENEEKWRKMRYEREIFLKKSQRSQSVDLEEDLPVNAASQIIKLGQAAIKRSLSTPQNVSVQSEKHMAPAKLENPSGILLNKRGSFLTRPDQVLERVAEFTKTLAGVASNTKNSKNFVFQSVSESTKTILMNKKRKAMVDSPPAIKRLRLNNLSPLVQKIGRNETL
ncbi:hypothetical protein Trydic_g15568 [Trypoxylus dichotomus]